MTVRYDFVVVPETLKVVDDEFQIVVVEGNQGDVASRTEKSEIIEVTNQIFDTESSNILKTPSILSVIEGGVEVSLSWENDDITEFDLQRLNLLTQYDYLKNGSFEQTSWEEAMANKSYKATYTFGNDYETLQEKGFSWGLYAKYVEVKETHDNTKLVCFLSKVEGYSGSVLDIGVGETKTINKSDNLMYLFFSQNCSIGDTQISQLSLIHI